jgi:hypothetical protein
MNAWHWLVLCDNAVENPFVADTASLPLELSSFLAGEWIEEWKSDATIGASKPGNDGIPDDALQNHLGLPVLSRRLQEALTRQNIGGIQFLPVRVFRPTGAQISGFAIANILTRKRAMVREQSVFEVFPADYFLSPRRGEVRSIVRAVLDQRAIDGLDIFRLDEYPRRIYVSDRFRRTVEEGRFTGLGFSKTRVVHQ